MLYSKKQTEQYTRIFDAAKKCEIKSGLTQAQMNAISQKENEIASMINVLNGSFVKKQ